MDLKGMIQTLGMLYRDWIAVNPTCTSGKADELSAELTNALTALECGMKDVAEHCYRSARELAQEIGIVLM